MDKSEVLEALHEKVIDISFEKADGTLRVMKATLNEQLIPKAKYEDPLSTKKVRTVSPEVCVVWDYAVEDWRSFRWDRLKGIGDKVYNGKE